MRGVLLAWADATRRGLREEALAQHDPLAVIFALLAFGQLFGFVGVLVALPVSAALLAGVVGELGATRRGERRLSADGRGSL